MRAAMTRPARERGTALMLVPALVAVVIGLGAIAVDGAVLHAAHRGTHRVVSSAADDAASAIDEAQLHHSGELRIDVQSARRIVEAHLDAAHLPGRRIGAVEVHVGNDAATVEVGVRIAVSRVLLGAFPGVEDEEVLHVRARARLNR